jgi:hypothetical protein
MVGRAARRAVPRSGTCTIIEFIERTACWESTRRGLLPSFSQS